MTTDTTRTFRAAAVPLLIMAALASCYFIYAAFHGPYEVEAGPLYGVANTDDVLVVFNCYGPIGLARIKRGGLSERNLVWEATSDERGGELSQVKIIPAVGGYEVSGPGLDTRTGKSYLSELRSEGHSVLRGALEFDAEDLEKGSAMTGMGPRTVAQIAAAHPACLTTK